MARDVKISREILYVSPRVLPSMYYIYILRSLKNNSFYIGYSSDLRKRIIEHNSGKTKSTQNNKPYELIHYEAFSNMKDAKAREEYLKTGWGWRSIKKMMKEYMEENGPGI